MSKEYLSTNAYCRRVFGRKVYKLALSAATTCPNRDGACGYGGCTFCSAGGSGDFAQSASRPVSEQIEAAKRLLGKKGEGMCYIAYFQSFTGTYGDLAHLESMYRQAADHPQIAAVSIATRPDCLGDEAIAMLSRLAARKPFWVEVGLQTIHERTAHDFNRGYGLPVYDEAMQKLKMLSVHRITHVILGLPGETREQMLETVRYVGQRTDGIKLQLLHILRGTALADRYAAGEFQTLEPQTYYDLVADCLEALPEHIVVHRLTGDGAKRDLIAPLWSADKKRVLADLTRTLRLRGIAPISEPVDAKPFGGIYSEVP